MMSSHQLGRMYALAAVVLFLLAIMIGENSGLKLPYQYKPYLQSMGYSPQEMVPAPLGPPMAPQYLQNPKNRRSIVDEIRPPGAEDPRKKLRKLKKNTRSMHANFAKGNVPDSPCPQIFAYQYDQSQGGWYGYVVIAKPADTIVFNVEVNMTIIRDVKQGKGISMKLLSQAVEVSSGNFIRWAIYFPFQDLLPKMTRIKFNEQVICSGDPDPRKGKIIVSIQRPQYGRPGYGNYNNNGNYFNNGQRPQFPPPYGGGMMNPMAHPGQPQFPPPYGGGMMNPMMNQGPNQFQPPFGGGMMNPMGYPRPPQPPFSPPFRGGMPGPPPPPFSTPFGGGMPGPRPPHIQASGGAMMGPFAYAGPSQSQNYYATAHQVSDEDEDSDEDESSDEDEDSDEDDYEDDDEDDED